jgi:secondary thiamine-phosphate synthase enzyme
MIETQYIHVDTKPDTDIVNITEMVCKIIDKSKITHGIVVIFVPGSTAAISTIEYEKNLINDVKQALNRIVPYNIEYEHHKTWGDDNGASHVRATLNTPSLVVPFVDKRLILGTWQQIVLMDFDTKHRTRKIVLQIIGE